MSLFPSPSASSSRTATSRSTTAGPLGATTIVLALMLSSCSSGSAVDRTAAAPTPTTAAGTTATTTPVAPATSTPAAPSDSPEPDIDPQPTATRPIPSEETNRALIDAAWNNDLPLARELIAEGADVNYKDNTEQSAYLIATSEGYLELLELTLDNGADVGSLDSFNGTGLIRAAERGHADIVGRLLQTDIDVNHINNLGWTALHEAIILGDGDQRAHDTVRLLIAGGADVRLRSQRDDAAPIDMARDRGQNDIAATIQTALDAQPTSDPDSVLLAAAGSGDADSAALAIAAEQTSKPEIRISEHRSSSPLPTTTRLSPESSLPWAPTQTRSTIATTRHGSSPESPAASKWQKSSSRPTRISPSSTGSAAHHSSPQANEATSTTSNASYKQTSTSTTSTTSAGPHSWKQSSSARVHNTPKHHPGTPRRRSRPDHRRQRRHHTRPTRRGPRPPRNRGAPHRRMKPTVIMLTRCPIREARASPRLPEGPRRRRQRR